MLTDLAVAPISETIRRLSAERHSGDLQVRSGKIAKMVFFDHGRVVFAASNLKNDRLGEALVSLGQITSQQFDRASGLMKEDRTLRFGDALVRAGVMDKKQLGTSVARFVAKIVVSLFELDAGAASFEERNCPIPVEFMVSLSVHRLLRAGIKSMTNRDLILAGAGDLNRSVTLATVPPFAFKLGACSADEVDMLEKAKTRVTMRRLASTPKGLSVTRLRIAYAFLASGILEDGHERAGGTVPQLTVQSDAKAFLLSPLYRQAESATAGAPVAMPPPPAATLAAPVRAADRTTPAAAVTPAPVTPPAGVTPTAEAPPAPRTSSSMSSDGTLEAERLLSQANVHLMISNFAGAVQAFAQLVELQPDVAAHRLRLAVAMARHPPTERQAERQFIEAVRLDPDNVDLHYRFGLYYKALKVRSRAVAEFRIVVRLDPRHKQARAELEATSPDDSVLVSLKRLLK